MREDALKIQLKQNATNDIGVVLEELGQNDKTTKIIEIDEPLLPKEEDNPALTLEQIAAAQGHEFTPDESKVISEQSVDRDSENDMKI